MAKLTKDELRQQNAAILLGAVAIAGSRDALATELGVSPGILAEWLHAKTDAPQQTVDKAIDVILRHDKGSLN